MSLKSFDSGNFPTIKESIDHSKYNKIEIGNVSFKAEIDGKAIIRHSNIFKPYKNIILGNLIEVEVPEEYYYRPDAVSKKFYESVDFWYIILWVNGMQSVIDFTKPKVKIFNPNKLSIINDIIETYKQRLAINKKKPQKIDNLTIKNPLV